MNTCPTFENWIVSFWGFCTSESSSESWLSRRVLGNTFSPWLRGEGVEAGLCALWEGCTYCCMCTHTHRTWRCHGIKCTLLEHACPREFRFKSPCARSDSHYGSINSHSVPAFPCFQLCCGGNPNRQQCLAGVEGKLVREVKVNNIPCCLQWAGDC